jgi:hypothetical protein
MAISKIIKKYDKIMNRNIREWINYKVETEIISQIKLDSYLTPLRYLKII